MKCDKCKNDMEVVRETKKWEYWECDYCGYKERFEMERVGEFK